MEEDSSAEWKTPAFDQVNLTNVPVYQLPSSKPYKCTSIPITTVNSQLSTAFDTDASVVGPSQGNELRKLTIIIILVWTCTPVLCGVSVYSFYC